MKVFKKMSSIAVSGLLVAALCIVPHAVDERTSEVAYSGPATYWASAAFTGGAYVEGSAGMHCIGGTLSGTRSNSYVTWVSVSSYLSYPNNYNIPISRSVYSGK